MMTYQEALDYINSTGWKGSVPGLERIKELLDSMGNPERSLRFIHVVGTNGKGSVCAFLSSILTHAGYKTGLFISPFIEVFNERMQINGKNIENDELAQITQFVKPYADAMSDKPTEFELNTAIAMEYFKRNKCDIVVLEAGMGGEFDSTNVIDTPILAIITAIGLDHTAYLGDSVEKIAKTKSGIIKSGGRVILYKQDEIITNVIKERCKAENASLYISQPELIAGNKADLTGQSFNHPSIGVIHVTMPGKYELNNAAVVIKAIQVLNECGYDISNDDIREGFSKTIWPGRFEVLHQKPPFVLDGAHNPQGAQAAAESIREIFPAEKVILIFGVLADKDYTKMLQYLLEAAREVIVVSPPGTRALEAHKTADEIRKITDGNMHTNVCDNIKDAVCMAFEHSEGELPIFAAGSLYMAGEIRNVVKKIG